MFEILYECYDTLTFTFKIQLIIFHWKINKKKQRKEKKLENVIEYIFRVSKMIVKDITMRSR